MDLLEKKSVPLEISRGPASLHNLLTVDHKVETVQAFRYGGADREEEIQPM